jgi:adenosine deaminase
MARLAGMFTPDGDLPLDGIPGEDPDYIIAKIADALLEGAADGALLVEVRFGAAGLAILRPDFMALFREAERQAQASYPRFYAEAIGFLSLVNDPLKLALMEQQFEVFLRLAKDGLAGLDFVVNPYDREADPVLWDVAYRWAARAADAGLGITVHAGEFSPANLAAALRVPGLQRLGHAVYAAAEPRLMAQLVARRITVECCLSCNVVLGAAPSYEAHPIAQLVEAGVPVTLNTDDPVRIWTTIGREYAIAAALGFSPFQLLQFTQNACEASFTSAERRATLLDELRHWQAAQVPEQPEHDIR